MTSKVRNYLLPFVMVSLKPRTIIEKVIVTVWFLLHVVIAILFIIGTIYMSTQTISHYHNSHLSPQEYGKLIKQTYPVYDNLTDEQVGSKFLAKRQMLKKSWIGETLTTEDFKARNIIMDFDATLNTDWINDVKTFAYFVFIPSIIGLIGSNFVLSNVYKIWKKHD